VRNYCDTPKLDYNLAKGRNPEKDELLMPSSEQPLNVSKENADHHFSLVLSLESEAPTS
jgi:hypothetical protein